MNPLVKKEIRLLLPAWTTAMLLAIVPTWIASVWSRVPSSVNGYVELAFAFGVLFLSIASFGEEFSLGTFPALLSQPRERRRIWAIKTSVLGIAFLTVLLASIVSWNFDLYIRTARIPGFWARLGFSALFVAVIFSTGLWATLLVRRMLEAFWLTLVAPLALVVAFYGLRVHFHWSDQTDIRILPAILLLYSVAGFFWARRIFSGAQDIQWTGGEIIFPWHKGISGRTMAVVRRRHWFTALFLKEIQLHQANILIAGIVLVLDVASVIIRKVHPHFTDRNVEGFLELVWALWLLMPLLIGSVAVAEEHRSGTFESQLCLPVSRRAQLAVKFSVALILSMVLGGVMPFVIEWGRDFNDSIFIVAAALFFISFYASTVARTTLQAIGLAIAVSVVLYSYEVATAISVFKLGGAWSYIGVGLELLKLYLGIPILLLSMAGLMYWNFKWLHSEAKLRWRNGITLCASFAAIFILTNGIYFRTWEFLTPVASPNGLIRLSNAREVKLAANRDAIYGVLPDGRLWVDILTYKRGDNRWTSETIARGVCKSQLVQGSNWIAVAADQYEAVGIRSDGSLWSLQRQWNPLQHRWCQTGVFNVNRIGSETNWLQVAAGWGNAFLVLKSDGGLWIWGTNGYDWHDSNGIQKKLKLDLTTPPVVLDRHATWIELFSANSACAKKGDGSLWKLEMAGHNRNQAYEMVEATNLDEQLLDFASSGAGSSVGVKSDGELWFFWNDWTGNNSIPRKVQLGQKSKWNAAAFSGWNSFLAIRSDGTLWNWNTSRELGDKPYWTKPVQLGNYSNWITFPTAQTFGTGAFTLAADGSIWVWGEPSAHVWLMPSRKPVYLGNIFSAQQP